MYLIKILLTMLILVGYIISEFHSFKFPIYNHINKRKSIDMAIDIPYIPALIGTAGLVFAVFNIENPVDLTDAGRAKTKAKRRAEKLARGESIQPKEGFFLP